MKNSDIIRITVSAFIVGFIAFGNTLQAVISTGQEPTKWQMYSAILGGLILAFNDIKSRITPSPMQQPPLIQEAQHVDVNVEGEKK